MEGNREIAAALDDQPAVELIAESDELDSVRGEHTAAELFAESDESAVPDEPTKPAVTQSLPPKIVPAETDSQPVLELEADPRAQFQDNCKMVAARSDSSSLIIVAAICAVVHHTITQEATEPIPIVATLIIIAIVFRTWYVRREARNHAKTKFSLSEKWLTASGPDIRNNWRIPISNLDKATLICESNSKKSLVLSDSVNTRVLRGLEDPEKLLRSLPQEIQVDTSGLQQKLQEFADSMSECKDADEVEKLRDAEHVQTRVAELIQEFPDARVLKQDLSHIAKYSKQALMIVGVILTFAYLGYPQISLPLLPIAIFAYLPGLLSLRRTLDCLYVFSDNALYELNRKLGTVHTISLNRVINRKHLSEDGVLLYIDNNIRIPARIEKADADYIKGCLIKYPSSDSI